jgi:hypothetical protein
LREMVNGLPCLGRRARVMLLTLPLPLEDQVAMMPFKNKN